MKYVKIGQLVDLKQGLAINAKSNHLISKDETNIALLRIADMPTKRKVIYMKEETPERYIANKNDIIYTRTGQVGLVFTGQHGVVHNNCFRVFSKNDNILSNEYLYWCLRLKSVYIQANNFAVGSAQPDLPHTSFRKIRIPLFSINAQNKIAKILQRYDDLIEKNNRKIAILEEQIQELYKEWFVRFRFPGYENVKFVNGLPQGWRVGSLLDIMVLLDSKRKPLSSIERDEKDKIYPYYGAAELIDYIDEYIFDGRYILMGEDGSVITKDGYPELQYVEGKFWVNNHAHVIIGKDEYHINFVYSLLKKLPVNDIVTGASQPKISQGRMLKKKILIPNIDCITDYCNVVNPIFEEIFLLKELVKKETNTRDLLLPRLMSGKLKV